MNHDGVRVFPMGDTWKYQHGNYGMVLLANGIISWSVDLECLSNRSFTPTSATVPTCPTPRFTKFQLRPNKYLRYCDRIWWWQTLAKSWSCRGTKEGGIAASKSWTSFSWFHFPSTFSGCWWMPVFFWVVKPTLKWQNGSRTYLCWINLNCHCWSRILFAHVQVLHQLHISHEYHEEITWNLACSFHLPILSHLAEEIATFPSVFRCDLAIFSGDLPILPKVLRTLRSSSRVVSRASSFGMRSRGWMGYILRYHGYHLLGGSESLSWCK